MCRVHRRSSILTEDPQIGVHGGSYSEDTVCYISPMEYVYSYKNHTKLDDSDLWNLTVMNELLNGDGQFQVEDDISAGYYPKVIMPDDMMEKQPSITLPGTVGSAAPEALDAVVVDSGVDEQGNDYVIANIRFINSRKRQITEINIDGLDCEILGYPEDTNEYAVQVKLTNPQVFHSEYELKNFTYKISAIGDATRTVEYGADTQNGAKYLKVEFWRNISNLEEWNDAFADDKIDLTGNYRITSDIDFSGQPGGKVAQISKKYLGSGKYDGFTGNIRGAAGKDRTGTVTLKNYPAEKGYVIEVMEKGGIENLIVDGLSFDEFTGVNMTMGMVGMASKSEFDHIEMRNVTMPGVSSSAGALAGSLTDCTVTWCSVTGAEITTTQPQGTAYELAVGRSSRKPDGYKGQLLLCIGCGNYGSLRRRRQGYWRTGRKLGRQWQCQRHLRIRKYQQQLRKCRRTGRYNRESDPKGMDQCGHCIRCQ